jgi:hypothetical protein
LLAPGPSQPDASPLDRLVLGCDRAVRARIANIHQFPRRFQYPQGGGDPVLEEPTVRVLELEVEETYWGRAEAKSLFVLDDIFYRDLRLHGRPEKGEDSIWFLEMDPWFERLDPLTRERIAKLAGNTGLQVVGSDGLGRLRIEDKDKRPVVCLHQEVWSLPSALPVVGSHSSKNPDRKWVQVAQSAFEEWLHNAIQESIPSVEVDVVSTCPGQSRVTIDKRGHAELVRPSGGTSVEIGTDGLQKLLDLASNEHFFELPSQLGDSQYPDSPIYLLRIRAERGGRQVHLRGFADPKQDSRALLDAHSRAMRIWDAIPLAREWKISGH